MWCWYIRIALVSSNNIMPVLGDTEPVEATLPNSSWSIAASGPNQMKKPTSREYIEDDFPKISLGIVCYFCSYKTQENIRHILFVMVLKGIYSFVLFSYEAAPWASNERPGANHPHDRFSWFLTSSRIPACQQLPRRKKPMRTPRRQCRRNS